MNSKGFLTPQETATAIVEQGRRVLTQPWQRTLVLSLLAGFYIAFGAQLAVVVTQDAAQYLGTGVSKLLGGSVFSLGLMLVVICGAELFTGNILLVKAALQKQIPWWKIGENWVLVICGNFIGALFFAWLMIQTDLLLPDKIAANVIGIAASKTALSFKVAFVRGILCNWLVCLAVFMAVAARDISGKILACYVPIMAFVASGFEHSVANMYFIPAGILLSAKQLSCPPQLCWENFFVINLLPVTLGNIAGGVIFVACAYWFAYLKQR